VSRTLSAKTLPPTDRQIDYARAIQRKLHMPDRMLDHHCRGKFGKPFAGLDRAEMSRLIDQIAPWVEMPSEMLIAMGQQDLPGFGR
jgi:hypothetical protein